MPGDAKTRAGEPLLLTPGPLSTSPETKAAMLRDWGSRDSDFIALTARLRRRLTDLVRASGSHVCVPLQGSGTFALEAALGSLIPREGKALVLVNGAYGRRIAKICGLLGRAHEVLQSAEDTPPEAAAVAARLDADAALSDVVMVHCETTSGILNPLEAIAAATAARGRRLLVDAMSSFGGIPLDAGRLAIDGIMASANKCLEGVPGVGFVIVRERHLETCAGNSPSLSLDLHAQWRGLEDNGQWRFTPPTQVLAALDQALDELDAEGGVAGRFARYWENCRVLVDGMRALGFETLLADERQAPIIVTFLMPADPKFEFQSFYDTLAKQGYIIYPGKLTEADSFRIGCIGHLDAAAMRGVIAAVRHSLSILDVHDLAPAQGAAGTAA